MARGTSIRRPPREAPSGGPQFKHLVETFYEGSAEQAVAALLGGEGSRLSDEELDRIEDLIHKARKDGRR